jgi:Tfp pilus assembly protein FimT
MVVIAVLAILSAVAAPSIATFISTQRLRNAAFDLVSDLCSPATRPKSQTNVVISRRVQVEVNGRWLDNYIASGHVTSRLGVPA